MSPKHKIAINCRFLLQNKLEGIGNFTYQTCSRLIQQHPEIEFHCIYDRKEDVIILAGKNVSVHHISPPARHPFLWYIWFELSLARLLKTINPNFFYSPDGYMSLSTNTPTYLVIHDLAYEHFPEDVPFLVRKYYQHFIPKYAHAAKRIATVSNFSKLDIAKRYDIQEEKIDLVYSASNLEFTEGHKFSKKSEAPYFTCLSSINPRKNLISAIRAFEQFCSDSKTATKLYIIGANGWRNSELELVWIKSKFKDQIIFLGRLEPFEVMDWLKDATALLFLSKFEGFGVPPLEAMQLGCPVIAANNSSIKEICADAAILVDAMDISEITSAMQLLLENEELKRRYIAKGKEHQKQFNWDRTADLLWNGMQELLDKIN